MKKLILLSLSLLVIFTIVSREMVSRAAVVKNEITTNASIPDSISKIFQNSCYACHAEGGNMMAMSKVNFSEWDKLSPEKQAKKAAAICKVVSKGSMPPGKFQKKHADKVPTQAQKVSICAWAKSLKTEKK